MYFFPDLKFKLLVEVDIGSCLSFRGEVVEEGTIMDCDMMLLELVGSTLPVIMSPDKKYLSHMSESMRAQDLVQNDRLTEWGIGSVSTKETTKFSTRMPNMFFAVTFNNFFFTLLLFHIKYYSHKNKMK